MGSTLNGPRPIRESVRLPPGHPGWRQTELEPSTGTQMATRRFLTGLTCAVLLFPVSATAAATAEDPGQTIQGEVQRLAIETFDGTDVAVTVVVPESGDVVRVQSEDLADVLTGAIVEVTLESVEEETQDVEDPSGGADVQAAEVLEQSPVP